jgi:hypothetical protein
MIVTHCGEAIIADEAAAYRQLEAKADRLNISLIIAHDGLCRSLN